MEVIRHHSKDDQVIVEQTKMRRSDFTTITTTTTNTSSDISHTSSNSTSDSNTSSGIEDSNNNSEVSWSNNTNDISRNLSSERTPEYSALQWSSLEKIFNGKAVVIPQIVNAVGSNGNVGKVEDSFVFNSGQTSGIVGEESGDVVRSDLELGESDDEVIELEFERAFEKVHTHTRHTPYCPNCNSQITRVVLRRKRREADRVKPLPRELFGCLSCFSVFVPSGNCLNPFSLFGSKEKHTGSQAAVAEKDTSSAHVPVPVSSGSSNESVITTKPGSVLNLLGIFGVRRRETYSQHPEGNVGENNQSENFDHTTTVAHSGTSGPVPPKRGRGDSVDESTNPGLDDETWPPLSVGSVIIDIKDGKGEGIKVGSTVSNTHPGTHYQDPTEEIPGRTGIQQQTNSGVYSGRQELATRGFEPAEILRCIVYGGLVESIASLGLVSSAASSGATKLNIVTLGLANVIGGLFVIGHKLMDMKTDTEHHGHRYKELLGNKENLLLHATLAMLSFLVFGLLPPVMYGFTEIWAVGGASFACIVILAIAKAYVKGFGTFGGYVKSIMYYVTMAISVSGIAYFAGIEINKLLERLGWFEPSQASPTFVSTMDFGTQAWSSY